MCECSCWTSCRIFGSHWMARSYGVLKPGRGIIRLPSQSDCSGRDYSSKHHFSSIGTKANRAWVREGWSYHWKKEIWKSKRIIGQNGLSRVRRMEAEWTKWGMGTHNRDTSLFAMGDMDMGKTSLTKHSVRLTDNTPFMQHYWQTPPSMCEEVREYLKEMLGTGALQPSQ